MRHEPPNLHDAALGLAGAFLVIMLALIGQALAAPDAQAHTITTQDCKRYSIIRSTISKTSRTTALKRCLRGAETHAHAHCKRKRGGYRVRNACSIRIAFGGGVMGEQAVRIASCESGLRTWALGPRDEYGNQRPGLFQLGTYERRKAGEYTTRSSARIQAESARRWQLLTGGGWSAWECRP